MPVYVDHTTCSRILGLNLYTSGTMHNGEQFIYLHVRHSAAADFVLAASGFYEHVSAAGTYDTVAIARRAIKYVRLTRASVCFNW